MRRSAVVLVMKAARTVALVGLASGASLNPGESARQTAVFAGGCYWGTESVFEHVKGVSEVVSGFAVPGASVLAGGHTGYAEAARVVYDPSQITYEQLLQVFFLVAHDPTQVDRQGPDVGPQYRSAIFVTGDAQRQAARTYVDQLTQQRVFDRPIVTEITSLARFRAADDPRFADRNPDNPYVVQYDKPRLAEFRRRFPDLYHD